MSSIYEKDVKSVEEANAIIDKNMIKLKERYRLAHEQFDKEVIKRCECDRSSCARCLHVNNLMDEMNKILRNFIF